MLLGQKEIIIIVGPPPLVPLILLIFPFPPFDLCAKSPAAQYFSLGTYHFVHHTVQIYKIQHSDSLKAKQAKK